MSGTGDAVTQRPAVGRFVRTGRYALWRPMATATSILSGEFFLALGFKFGQPNGGTMILVRAAWVSVLMFAIALLIHSGSYAAWTWRFWEWPWQIDSTKLKTELAEYLPWLGAIFAGVYVALYARFSAQFNYLAGVYNQIMQTATSTPSSRKSRELQYMWWAGFIEDSLDLHLATKRTFSVTVWFMLEKPPIYDEFVGFTVDGDVRVKKLITALRCAIGDENLEKMEADKRLMEGGPPLPAPIRVHSAYHEAGHAVAAVVRGGSVGHVVLRDLIDEGLADAGSGFVRRSRRTSAHRDEPFVAFAGPYSEWRIRAERDEAHGMNLWDWLECDAHGHGIGDEPSDDYLIMGYRGAGRADLKAWVDEIEPRWSAIEAVAGTALADDPVNTSVIVNVIS
jgi:hypothetical protein